MSLTGSNIRLNPVGVAVIVVVTIFVLYSAGVHTWFASNPNVKVNMGELLAVSIEVAERGGQRVKAIRELADSKDSKLNAQVKGQTKEGADELKTNGDMESHRAMVSGMMKAFPGLKVISEEKDRSEIDFSKIEMPKKENAELSGLTLTEDIPMGDIAVWIDPLDATQEYTENLLDYVTTMVCVAVKGKPTIGVIHKPFKKETAWAYVGSGHSSNLKPAKDLAHKEGDPYKIIVSRSHAGKVEPVIKKSLGDKTDVIPAGGAGFKTWEVIKGSADAYVHVTRIKKWDICAGNAIINAVSGKMTTLKGDTIDYSAAGSSANDDGLLATLTDHKKFLDAFGPSYEELRKTDSH